MSTANKTSRLSLQKSPSGSDGELHFSGEWEMNAEKTGVDQTLADLRDGNIGRLSCHAEKLRQWDSSLIVVVLKLQKACVKNAIELDLNGLPHGVKRLVDMATAGPVRPEKSAGRSLKGVLPQVGRVMLSWFETAVDRLRFLGEVTASFGRFFTGRAQLQPGDIWWTIEETGALAFPIVGLIALLMGIILAFVGAVQLKLFGAEVFIADLVAIGIVRSLGAIMTGIVMAGRTGAAFAARIGTMQVNEEIDAFKTMGISPVDFLVVPRMVGLIVMMPLLCIYADVIGLLGGMLIGVGLLGLSPAVYIQRTREALSLNHFAIGLIMSVVFGFLVAFFGCFRGMRCGRSAQAVGEAVTSAVVSGIISIVIATAIITVLADILGM